MVSYRHSTSSSGRKDQTNKTVVDVVETGRTGNIQMGRSSNDLLRRKDWVYWRVGGRTGHSREDDDSVVRL